MKNHYLCKVLFALEYHDEHEDLYGSNEAWSDIIWSLNEQPWKGGKHSGDCTNEYHTCMVCFIEKTEERAQRLIDEAGNGFERLEKILKILDEK